MFDLSLIFFGRLGSSYIHSSVYLSAIGTYYLYVKALGNIQCQLSFAAGCRSYYGNHEVYGFKIWYFIVIVPMLKCLYSLIENPSTISANALGVRLAPPTRAPLMLGWDANSCTFSAFTLPPYNKGTP